MVATYQPILPQTKPSATNLNRGDNLTTGSDVIITNSTDENYVEINAVTSSRDSGIHKSTRYGDTDYQRGVNFP